MPLAFDTLSHGLVAFGFFNIDTDLLLLERYFFFASDFCDLLTRLAGEDAAGPTEQTWPAHYIPDPAGVGDLQGAIHGVRYTGFIGEVYRRFPFPARPEDFRQQPEGWRNRDEVESLLTRHARRIEIPFVVEAGAEAVALADYLFTRPGFHALLRYVWQGGWPRWRDGERPDSVEALHAALARSDHALFAGLDLEAPGDPAAGARS